MSYIPLTPDLLRHWLSQHNALSQILGGTPPTWRIREVSNGNLNLVFLVDGLTGKLCCKQSLPHVRVAPEWPMPLERALYEARYMQTIAPYVQGLTPQLFYYDSDMFLLVMENLTPHEVLRSALIGDRAPEGFSSIIGRYVAQSVHGTSWISQPFEKGSQLLTEFSGNTALTRITVDLILTDPYRPCDRNPKPLPELEADIHFLQNDPAIHVSVNKLQHRFLTQKQSLLHGDLHTGSIMLHHSDVRVIDGEFALMGPIGFDCGLYLANLFIHALAVPHKAHFIQAEISAFWHSFASHLRELLKQSSRGDAWSLSLPSIDRQKLWDEFLHSILQDMAGFFGLELIRRTIGFAQVADYTLCPTPKAELVARKQAVLTGHTLIKQAKHLHTFDAFLNLLAPCFKAL
ncbi:S-methyl-5-thioribose kinase [Swingsia samuiensis]|uniref:S-methyl-5-thioribose kinase n=1 Tax=Swingsia samuiensis TaxID=1293412 RepID=A0A4Y6UN66_9PROT|nr:S-methyl-5-thioribose kinase [Swingsia samuiensis]QDH17495.1 S-methyl-5-thioribose kinase [Swingsia samuiensis]